MSGSLTVAAREVGGLPLSIPTSEAMESLFGGENGKLNERHKVILINVRTLFRNLWSSLESATREMLKPEDYPEVLKQEMEVILSYVGEKSNGLITPVFYQCSYIDLSLQLPKADLKQANTAKQRFYLTTEKKAIELVMRAYQEDFGIRSFKTKIEIKEHAVMLTHSPIDLLFNDLYSVLLLESHTGKLKKPFEWNTKLTNGKVLGNIPFNKFTIQIFGDNNTYISQKPNKIRQAVLEMAESDNWSAVTTNDKIRFSINKMRDLFGRNYLLQVLKS